MGSKKNRSILSCIGYCMLQLDESNSWNSFIGNESLCEALANSEILVDFVMDGSSHLSFGYGIRLYVVQYLLPRIDLFLEAQRDHAHFYRAVHTSSCIEIEIDSLLLKIDAMHSRIDTAKFSWVENETNLAKSVLSSKSVCIEELNEEIKKYSIAQQVDFNNQERKLESIISSLTKILSSYWSIRGFTVELTPYGSFTNSLFTDESDLDITLSLFKNGKKVDVISGHRHVEIKRRKLRKAAAKLASVADDEVVLTSEFILQEVSAALHLKSDFAPGRIVKSKKRVSLFKTVHKLFNRNVISVCPIYFGFYYFIIFSFLKID